MQCVPKKVQFIFTIVNSSRLTSFYLDQMGTHLIPLQGICEFSSLGHSLHNKKFYGKAEKNIPA